MKCLWPSTKSTNSRALAVVLWVGGGLLAWCAIPSTTISHNVPLTQLERIRRRSPAHISEFSPVSSPLMALPRCGNVQPPEALLTPDPLLHVQDDRLNVRVSFIVGTDGHVHSAFVLESGGPAEDQVVLRAVRFWRYRPALCNGVPMDSEARIRFSLH
jgi:TonB family protein